ncbi:MAG: hypothetical protein AAFW73_18535 [Bacteroidota bacterium]
MKSITILLKYTTALLWGICWLVGPAALAQSPREVFESAFDKYGDLEHLSLDMEAFSFVERDSPQGTLVFQGSFKKRGKAFYSKAWEREMIVNDNRMLVVNHDEQNIVLGRARGLEKEALGFPRFTIDSLVARGGKFEYLGLENGEQRYRLKAPDAMIYETDVFINADGLVTRMVYHYQELAEAQPAMAKLEIYYRNISFQPPLAIFFDESKFLLHSKTGTLVAAPRYRAYTVREVDYATFSESSF